MRNLALLRGFVSNIECKMCFFVRNRITFTILDLSLIYLFSNTKFVSRTSVRFYETDCTSSNFLCRVIDYLDYLWSGGILVKGGGGRVGGYGLAN